MAPIKLAPVRIWDLPTRLTHWLLVVLFGCSWWTAEHDELDWHRLSGYAILTLVLFRLYWGFAGSDTARFASFVVGPRRVWAYARHLVRRQTRFVPGHNPMGGWSVVALIGLLLLQTGLGLFAVDTDGLESGPLASLIDFETGRRAAHAHGFVFNLLLGFIGLHLAAVAFYLVYKRENLVGAMVTGYRHATSETAARLRFAKNWHAIPPLLAAALLVSAIAAGMRF